MFFATQCHETCREKVSNNTSKINITKDYHSMYKANKKSAHYYASHTNDKYTELGYDYHNGTILSKTLSPVLFKNKKNKAMLSKVEEMICYMIDSVKQIRTHFILSLDKKDINVN